MELPQTLLSFYAFAFSSRASLLGHLGLARTCSISHTTTYPAAAPSQGLPSCPYGSRCDYQHSNGRSPQVPPLL
ncbi:hypothetical protein K469DRAFT_792053 [Zopfia rhizophila CBS 207.26]|uniref:C3H1-type domain-containing protein n=1 Tax=Zopfia rhizophila CBS 207.26 TaxID=1314779 RepID=A0A6A6DPZ4_9PEZI|nr:hypothetical protein K469DRAFT_792053 [Zopfia rhizophila CBS 207.26]